ncbi:MAG: hypothetical protein EPO13_11545 [Actinomycetota bacterium]|nr:MAG: hypothetical protein EPO13_11545 [Actinomycetota bacterium]
MFMQIIQGKVRDTAAAQACLDRWMLELAPGATGWLGTTHGFTDDGTLIAAVRFDSRESARTNSERPDQSAWWEDMATCFSEGATFHDCDDVQLLLGGGTPDAGFVQVIQGRVRDRARAQAILDQSAQMLHDHRPDVLGATIAVDADGIFTETVCFSSEPAAREGEAKPMPPQLRDMMAEEMSLLDDVAYFDLRHPTMSGMRG